MTQNPYDQLSKQWLEELLSPLGKVQRSLEIPGEAKFVDLWFEPNQKTLKSSKTTNLLEKIAQTACLLEPYRQAPTRVEIRTCILKLLWVQEDMRRKALPQAFKDEALPLLWIIATSVSKPILAGFGAQSRPEWGTGIYFLAQELGTALISVNELPRTPETLILRILGRGKTQQDAISDVLALPTQDAQRSQMLRILGNWKVTLELNHQIEFEERESIMAFSQAFLEWEQATEQKGIQKGLEQGLEQGEKSIIIRLLTRKVGAIAPSTTSQIQSLSLEKIEALGDALLEFNQLDDLLVWLEKN